MHCDISVQTAEKDVIAALRTVDVFRSYCSISVVEEQSVAFRW